MIKCGIKIKTKVNLDGIIWQPVPKFKPWAFLRCLSSASKRNTPLHHHSPQEAYTIRQGEGVLLSSFCSKKIYKDRFVYIPKNVDHRLKNNGEEELELLWIFPTEYWEEVEYTFEK